MTNIVIKNCAYLTAVQLINDCNRDGYAFHLDGTESTFYDVMTYVKEWRGNTDDWHGVADEDLIMDQFVFEVDVTDKVIEVIGLAV